MDGKMVAMRVSELVVMNNGMDGPREEGGRQQCGLILTIDMDGQWMMGMRIEMGKMRSFVSSSTICANSAG